MASGDAWNQPGFAGIDLGDSPVIRTATVRRARRTFPAVGGGKPWILVPISFTEEEVQAVLRSTWEEWGAGHLSYRRMIREGREAAIAAMLEEEWEAVRIVEEVGWGAGDVYSRSGPRRG